MQVLGVDSLLASFAATSVFRLGLVAMGLQRRQSATVALGATLAGPIWQNLAMSWWDSAKDQNSSSRSWHRWHLAGRSWLSSQGAAGAGGARYSSSVRTSDCGPKEGFGIPYSSSEGYSGGGGKDGLGTYSGIASSSEDVEEEESEEEESEVDEESDTLPSSS